MVRIAMQRRKKKKANAKTSEISGEDNGNTLIVSDGIKSNR